MAPRLEERTELKCRMCAELVPTGQYSYSQQKKKHRRRCPACVAYALYLRGDGPKPANAPVSDAKLPEEYGRIELIEQLLPPQKLSGVTHMKTIVIEPTASGPGQRRARTKKRKGACSNDRCQCVACGCGDGCKCGHGQEAAAADLPASYQTTTARKSRAERDIDEETLEVQLSSSSSSSKREQQLQFEQAQLGDHTVNVEEASSKKFQSKKAKKHTSPKPSHQRQLSSSDQARELYKRQLKGRRKIRASRDFDNEEEQPELLKGEKGRKRLSVLDGGYPRESMKPGPERVIGGAK